jgi:hypothetical protein
VRQDALNSAFRTLKEAAVMEVRHVVVATTGHRGITTMVVLGIRETRIITNVVKTMKSVVYVSNEKNSGRENNALMMKRDE